MSNTEFTYTLYIKTTPKNLWDAITIPKLTGQYWKHENISDWKKNSKWQHVSSDEKRIIKIVGKVLENAPTQRLVLSWALPTDTIPESEYSRVTFEIKQFEDMVCLNVIHSNLKPNSDMLQKISAGWPRVLSSLKSFLETGQPLNTWAGHQ